MITSQNRERLVVPSWGSCKYLWFSWHLLHSPLSTLPLITQLLFSFFSFSSFSIVADPVLAWFLWQRTSQGYNSTNCDKNATKHHHMMTNLLGSLPISSEFGYPHFKIPYRQTEEIICIGKIAVKVKVINNFMFFSFCQKENNSGVLMGLVWRRVPPIYFYLHFLMWFP